MRQGLVAEYSVPADHPGLGWRLADGTMTAMRITETGRQAIGTTSLGGLSTRRNKAGAKGSSSAYHIAEAG